MVRINRQLLFCVLFLLQASLIYSRTFAIVGGNTTIGVYSVNGQQGNLQLLHYVNISSPSPWVASYPPKNPTLVAATSNDSVILYSLNNNSGNLTKLSQVVSGGLNPAHISWDHNGRYLLVANYGFSDSSSNGSNVAVIPVVRENNGSYTLRNASAIVAHNGSSVNPDRQNGSHTHSAYLSLDGRYAYACDLGLDKIFQFLWPDNGTLPANPKGAYASPATPGSGPRHMAFHPDGVLVFVINEMGNSIDNFNYQSDGTLVGPFASVSTLPSSFSGASDAAEIAITPNGRFLYASNRGYDSIAAYLVDPFQTDFPLKLTGFYTQNISWPRGFAIDPTGSFLIVGSQNSNRIITLAINQENGTLTATGAQANFSFPQVVELVTVPDFDAPKEKWSIVIGAIIATMVFSMIFAVFILSSLLRLR